MVAEGKRLNRGGVGGSAAEPQLVYTILLVYASPTGNEKGLIPEVDRLCCAEVVVETFSIYRAARKHLPLHCLVVVQFHLLPIMYTSRKFSDQMPQSQHQAYH